MFHSYSLSTVCKFWCWQNVKTKRYKSCFRQKEKRDEAKSRQYQSFQWKYFQCRNRDSKLKVDWITSSINISPVCKSKKSYFFLHWKAYSDSLNRWDDNRCGYWNLWNCWWGNPFNLILPKINITRWQIKWQLLKCGILFKNFLMTLIEVWLEKFLICLGKKKEKDYSSRECTESFSDVA